MVLVFQLVATMVLQNYNTAKSLHYSTLKRSFLQGYPIETDWAIRVWKYFFRHAPVVRVRESEEISQY
jgi:hypothetical protein